MSKRRFIAPLALLVLGACASPEGTTADGPGWPGETWPTSTPEAEGIDPIAIDSFVAEVEAGVYGPMDAFMLIRNGKVVADHRWTVNYDSIGAQYDTANHQYNYDHPDWHPYYQGTQLHTMQSVTKSVTSAALGIAIGEGLIPGVDVPVMQYFESYEPYNTSPEREATTLEDLLTMRSGIEWYTGGGYSDTEHSTIVMELSDEWVPFVLAQPLDTIPGVHYQYNDGASVLIGEVIRQATGMRADEWTRERLFEPIGIREFHWKITPAGEADTEGGLYLKTEDLARFGYLFLRGGEWDGRQVVPREWVEASVRPIVADINPSNDVQDPGYGYQWWIPRRGPDDPIVYAANGYGGQFLLVAPELDLIAVFDGWNIHGVAQRSTWRVLQDRIIPHVSPAPVATGG